MRQHFLILTVFLTLTTLRVVGQEKQKIETRRQQMQDSLNHLIRQTDKLLNGENQPKLDSLTKKSIEDSILLRDKRVEDLINSFRQQLIQQENFIKRADANVLTYKDSIYFEERNIILHDKQFKLHQGICYNVPTSIDEEFCYSLTLIFIKPTVVKKRRVFDLATDTALVKSNYSISSVWNWGGDSTKVTGKIQIVDWGKRKVTIKENITVYDLRDNEMKQFIGTRTFTRRKGW